MSVETVQQTARLARISPQFLVDDLNRSIAYYRDQLGFKLDFVYETFYASVSRDGVAIHLKAAPKLEVERDFIKRNEHLDALIAVAGVQDLFAEFQRRGARIVKTLEARPWDSVDFYVEDLDGYVICFSELNSGAS